MIKYKYLDDLKVPREEQYQNWFDMLKKDERKDFWKEQRKTYGIDERETWNWNTEFMDYCYIHLKMYNEVNNVNLNYDTVDFEGKNITLQEAIDLILNWFEKDFYPDKFDTIANKEKSLRCGDDFNIELYKSLEEDFYSGYIKSMTLLIKIMPYLWW